MELGEDEEPPGNYKLDMHESVNGRLMWIFKATAMAHWEYDCSHGKCRDSNSKESHREARSLVCHYQELVEVLMPTTL